MPKGNRWAADGGFVDLTRPVTEDMATYPGEPPVMLRRLYNGPFVSFEISLSSHAGTSLDTPLHVQPDGGKSLGAYEVSRFILAATVAHLDLGMDEVIDKAAISGALMGGAGAGSRPGRCLLIDTGWARHWGSPRYWRHPFLGQDAAMAIAESDISLVGIDTPNVDSTMQNKSVVHRVLLGADVLVVENLCNLDLLDGSGRSWTLACLPLSVPSADGSPVRAVAW